MTAFSIIIPVYNTGEYLSECLESVIDQPIDKQIICVNDASDDYSSTILQSYRERYSFIEVYENIQNMGQAESRNIGIEQAKGRYICFLDSDDVLEPNILPILFDMAEREEMDYLAFDVVEFWDHDRKETNLRRVHGYTYKVTDGISLFENLVEHNEMYGSPCMGIYRRALIINQNIRFIPGILHEDIPFVFTYILHSRKAGVINRIGYWYRQRSSSTMHLPNYEQRFSGLLVAYYEMICVWQRYRCQADNITVKGCMAVDKYLTLIVNMLEHYYVSIRAYQMEISNDILQHFFSNFCFRLEDNNEEFFSQEDYACLETKGQRICMFGAGRVAKEILLLFQKRNIPVDKIYVTKKKMEDSPLFGIEVEELPSQLRTDILVVAISCSAQQDVVAMLESRTTGKIICTIREC